jgi:hypothetical protein
MQRHQLQFAIVEVYHPLVDHDAYLMAFRFLVNCQQDVHKTLPMMHSDRQHYARAGSGFLTHEHDGRLRPLNVSRDN